MSAREPASVPAGTLRASDADREETARRLHEAGREGRLTPEELDQRLEAAYASRTYGELARLVRDLPVPRAVVARPPAPRRRGRAPRPVAVAVALTLALLGAFVGCAGLLVVGSVEDESSAPALLERPRAEPVPMVPTQPQRPGEPSPDRTSAP